MDRRRHLTDMGDAEYSVDAAKAEFPHSPPQQEAGPAAGGEFRRGRGASQKAFDWQIMRRLLSYLGRYRRQLVAGVVLLLGYSAVAPVFPNLIARAVDNYIVAAKPPFDALSDEARFNGLLTIVLIYLASG